MFRLNGSRCSGRDFLHLQNSRPRIVPLSAEQFVFIVSFYDVFNFAT